MVAVLHGLTLNEFEEIAEGKGVFEEHHIIRLHAFDRYLSDLQARVAEVNDD